MADKIYSVVIGDVNGRISEVFGKLATLHAKQSFAFAIFAGQLFADPETTSETENDELSKLLGGEIFVPLPTYFSLGARKLPAAVIARLESEDGEVCPNLTLLGRKVSIKTSEGFRIVAIGGAHSDNLDDSMSLFDAKYRDSDVESLAKESSESSSADLLITSDWPAGVRHGARAAYLAKSPAGVSIISDLCTALKPLYHFSTSEAFYEREPFFHNGPPPRSVTRFLSLAPYGNSEKQKWIYAFSLEPSSPPPQSLPPGCTAPPFVGSKKRKLDSQQETFDSFRYAKGIDSNHRQPDRGWRNRRHKNQPPPTPDQCFFCISNAACETHMISSIGTDCYVAVAKGPLSTRTTFPGLGFPSHMLIVPLQHTPTLSATPDEDSRKATLAEVQMYRDAMHDMLTSKFKDTDARSKFGAVTWEISRGEGVHLHLQFLPVPVDLISRGLVEAAFDVEAENLSYPRFIKSAAEATEAEQGDHFKLMIWSETLSKDMILPIDNGFRFNLQFGRHVLAKLLKLESRWDWKACVQEKSEEEADATAFKEAFKEFDFSLQE